MVGPLGPKKERKNAFFLRFFTIPATSVPHQVPHERLCLPFPYPVVATGADSSILGPRGPGVRVVGVGGIAGPTHLRGGVDAVRGGMPGGGSGSGRRGVPTTFHGWPLFGVAIRGYP